MEGSELGAATRRISPAAQLDTPVDKRQYPPEQRDEVLQEYHSGSVRRQDLRYSLQNLFGGLSTACDFENLEQNGFCTKLEFGSF